MRELDLTALAASDVVAKAAILEDCVAVAADLAIWELLLDFSCDTIFDDDALIAVIGLVILVLKVPSWRYWKYLYTKRSTCFIGTA